GVARYPISLTSATKTPIAFSELGQVGGVAVGDGKIFVTDMTHQSVHVASTSTLQELSTFPFQTSSACSSPNPCLPGPITRDGNGNLWIIQTAVAYPIIGSYAASELTSVRCYTPSVSACSSGGQTVEITGLVNPTALVAD